MKENQFYANGRVAVLSTKLLGQDKLTRLRNVPLWRKR